MTESIPTPKRRRGRPRKWPSEAARREHEAAKRRLRNKSLVTSEEFKQVVALTKLADDLQQRVDELTGELSELRWRHRQLETSHVGALRRLDALTGQRRTGLASAAAPLNRAQRRAAERERGRP